MWKMWKEYACLLGRSEYMFDPLFRTSEYLNSATFPMNLEDFRSYLENSDRKKLKNQITTVSAPYFIFIDMILYLCY